MFAVSRTFSLIGVEAEPVHVELDVARGLPGFTIVGLPDAAVRESRERVRAALVNSGFDFPLQRITANLAPADIRKAGPGFDLAIAAAVLGASGQLQAGVLDNFALAGELALDGGIRPVPGTLAMAEAARAWGLRGIVVSPPDAPRAALVEGIDVIAVADVTQLAAFADGEVVPARPGEAPQAPADGPDLADLRGQPMLRRALEIAAAGAHSLLMSGPPGSGKTLAARRLPSLLPAPAGAELIEIARVAGVCGDLNGTALPGRPFRAPHHSCSAAALIGGGAPLRPGEVTRAHRGVLFLDELAEFRRDALEALRQPIEDGAVTVSRAGRAVSLPCRFLLVAAGNPCPCGRGEDSGRCECAPAAVARYRAKLSAALADRIDISLGVERIDRKAMVQEPGEASAAVRERVTAAREVQAARLGEGRTNGEMSPAEVRRHCRVPGEGEDLLAAAHDRLGLSGRGWDRVLKVARTIADLDEREGIEPDHVAEALALRRRER